MKKKITVIAFVCLCVIFVGILFSCLLKEGSLVKMNGKWSIGIYSGESLFHFSSPNNISNPILSARDVTDIDADFVADPFMIKKEDTWYMFFEILNSKTGQGDIGVADSRDGLNWVYKQVVLDEQFHLSYPYVFKLEEEYYMIPESRQADSLRLYKAVDFPVKWLFVKTLMNGNYGDSSIVYYSGKWWLFSETSNKNDTLSLYYANDLMGPWTEHPKSPIINGNANIARPGGRVLQIGEHLLRYTQDCTPSYGNQVRAFEIIEITPENYKEKEVAWNPILKETGTGWNAHGMHNIDPCLMDNGRWIACVDGYQKRLIYGFTIKIKLHKAWLRLLSGFKRDLNKVIKIVR